MSKLLLFLASIFLFSCSFHPFSGSRDLAGEDVYPYRVHLDSKHHMRVINNGVAALYLRLDMIKRAKSTLELEYFIFNPDTSGRLVVKELVAAAQRGVKVRILVDKSMAVFVLNEYYAKVLKENHIEIRYYNAASSMRISSVQFRNHRKLIVRDNEEAITGGRNIADEYFNLSKTFNFLDRDIWVSGEVVTAMKDTFDLYWESKITETPKEMKEPVRDGRYLEDYNFKEEDYKRDLKNFQKKMTEAKGIIADSDEDRKVLDYVMKKGPALLSATDVHSCSQVAFATDKEGATFLERLKSEDYNTNYRLLRKEIAAQMSKVKDEVVLDSPYFLKDKNSEEVLAKLFQENKKVTILTNSLGSTDAIYVSTVFNDTVKKYTKNHQFSAYTYKGTFSEESELMSDEIRASQWGTHSKTILYSDDAFMIGTFNIDHRSNFYNTEMALFCSGSPELARDVADSIKLRMGNAHHLNDEGKPDDGSPLLDGNSPQKKALYYFLKVPSSLMQFLL